MSTTASRLEHDLLGDKAVPADAYYGVQTARALENFHISGVQLRLYPNLIKALAMVKMAAARANTECGQFSKEILAGIEGACLEIIDGKLHDEFRLDVFQGGAGTSTNMNANEVIANRALEHLGEPKGRYGVLHPNDHVNASQGTSDVYPTALRVAAWHSSGRLLWRPSAPSGAPTQTSSGTRRPTLIGSSGSRSRRVLRYGVASGGGCADV